jgi:hypothetical protein
VRIPPITTALLLLPILGCAGDISMANKSVSAAERADCAAKGGEVKRVGMSGAPACVIPYADAGKVCSRNSDCLGACLVVLGGDDQPVPKAGEPMAGTCEATNSTFGCFTEIEEGKATASVCVD